MEKRYQGMWSLSVLYSSRVHYDYSLKIGMYCCESNHTAHSFNYVSFYFVTFLL
jgi:hypothetical protein